jgi:hypothetical protein
VVSIAIIEEKDFVPVVALVELQSYDNQVGEIDIALLMEIRVFISRYLFPFILKF